MSEFNAGRVLEVKIEDEMRRSYLDYAMSVIVGRALPDVRDGLKPVHRRVLFAMRELGLTPDKSHKKSARVVGEVLGKYHPHGDTAVYDTAVRMAQDFVTRYPLVDGHGNFGSVDGDSAAAMRYTEMRLSPIALELLTDIDKDTVDFIPNFDESLEEPAVLPARFPNLLVNGSAGIAVGMATNIPPHNLREVIDAVTRMIDDPGATVEDLLEEVKGPDFPTGGMVLGREGLEEAYRSGRGSIRMRGIAEIEPLKNGKNQIIITELPYQVNKARLIERIAEMVREKKIDGISDLRDETDRDGMRVVVELRKDAKPQVVLNRLYKHTQLEDSFGIILLALVDGRPQVMDLRQILEHYLDHQKEVIRRRSQFELNKAEARAHILEGLRVALDHLDAVIALIRGSQTVEEAREGLQERFGLSEKQAQAILDMRLQRLTALEREKVEEEYRDLSERIAYLKSVLASEALVLQIVREELNELKERYGDARRTRVEENTGGMDEEDLIPEEDVVVTLTHAGYIKRMPIGLYRSQHRGGRGIVGIHPKEEDFVEHLLVTTTHYQVLFFTNYGRVFRLKVHEVPEASRQSRGIPLVNLVSLDGGEWITAVIPVRNFSDGYLMQATRRGQIKKTELASYDSWRKNGLLAVKLDPGDELMAVKLVRGDEEIFMGTRRGKAIRFFAEEVRPTGRVSRGVRGIKLEPGDQVVGMERVDPGAELLVATTNGFGKRTPIEHFRRTQRGGKGVRLLRLTQRTGEVAGIKTVQPGTEVMLVSALGVMIRLKADEICCQGRDARGVTLMRLEEGDQVRAVTSLMGQGDA